MQSPSDGQWILARWAVAMLAVLIAAGSGVLPAAAETYYTETIATNAYEDPYAVLAGFDYAVWSGSDGSHRQIYTINSSGVTTPITNTANDNIIPVPGSSNCIAWSGYDGHDWEIFFYNGSSTKQLTNNEYDDGHSSYTFLNNTYYTGLNINSSNMVVWSGYNGTDKEIYLYNPSTNTTTSLTNNNEKWDDFPVINNNGAVAWRSLDNNTYLVVLYNGGTTIPIASGNYNFSYLRLNNKGQLAWSSSDGNDNEIYLYSNGVITQITNNNYDDSWEQLSDDGRLTWQGYDGSHYQIYSYSTSTGTTTQITNSAYDNYMPRLAGGSPNPKIVWFGSDGSDYEIYLYNGTSIQQLTNNNYNDEFPRINGAGQILWTGYDGSKWNLYAAVGAYSRYDFVYYYDPQWVESYTGYVYAPNSFSSFISKGTNIYYEPSEMGAFTLDGGYYNITNITEGYDAYWDKKSYINSYYEATYATSLSVNMNGSSTAASIYVADRSKAHESGYALFNYEPSYFDPFTLANTYSSTGFSKYNFVFYYNTGGDYYEGYVYFPTDWATDMMSSDHYNQPTQMGGGTLAGRYHFSSKVDGYGPSYNKKGYVTSYYDAAVGQALYVNASGGTTPGTISVTDRLTNYEKGYAIYGSSYQYFDPYTSVNFSP